MEKLKLKQNQECVFKEGEESTWSIYKDKDNEVYIRHKWKHYNPGPVGLYLGEKTEDIPIIKFFALKGTTAWNDLEYIWSHIKEMVDKGMKI